MNDRQVTEQDLRIPEFRHARLEDLEFRDDGKVVRKDRWETGVRNIASALGWVRKEWEIPEVVEQAKLHIAAAQQLSPAVRDVLAERSRQHRMGYEPEHDDEHVNDEIAAMAAFYLMPPAARDWSAESTGHGDTLGEAIKPEGWDGNTGDRRRELVKGIALAIAELERLDRAAAAQAAPT